MFLNECNIKVCIGKLPSDTSGGQKTNDINDMTGHDKTSIFRLVHQALVKETRSKEEEKIIPLID